MKHVLRLAILGLATTSLINCTDADEQAPSGDDTQIDRNDDGAPLTPPSQDAPEKVVRSYLRGKVGAATDQLVMEKQFTANGITHVRLEQTVSGLRVYGAYVKAAVAANGALLQSIHKVAPMSPSVARTQLADADALRTVLVELGYGIEPALLKTHGNTTTFVRTQEMYREPTVERVAYLDGRMLREGFLVVTWSQRGNQLDHTLVGGDGVIVSRELRTANESYQVYTEDPLKGGVQTVTSTGWQTGAQTTVNMTGPNVHAYLDTDANNAPDAGGTAVTDGNFGGGGVNLTTAPSTAQNKAFAVQQLFYFNNVMHDDLEAHGFTNAQGNFEGNDPVNAEAQDGSGTDNANFSTPTDGQSPRMQMYLWTGAGPNAFVHVGTTDYGAYNSSFGPQLTATATAATAMAVASPADGCTAVSGVSGKVAIIDRGTCDFVTKVTNAQTAGAKSVIIVNNVASNPFSPGGTARKISIPSVMVSQADGATLKSLVPQTATLRKNTVTPLQIDGDLDADIVFHEYGHGLTWRMIGSMSGALAGAIGEGASDVNAFLHNGDPIMAEYAFSDPAGIRRYPYNAYGLTLKDWTGAEVHNDGEIYAAAMWSVFENYLASGLTASDLLTDFVDGMNFTPAGPRPEQMRDGMLSSLAARGLTARNCNVSRGFAKLGIGVGASTSVSRRGVVTVVESFAVPAGCPAP